MSKIALFIGGMLAIVMLIGMWLSGNYNSLITAKKQVELAWGTVETSYQYRFDIIDNLVESVKSSQTQEKEIFGKIADSRKMYNEATTPEGKTEAINTNFALMQRLQEAAYPELKSNENVQALMNDLRGTEGTIKEDRKAYNKVATNYNTNILSFPKNIFASMFGFKEVTLFKSDVEAAKAIKVKF